ncbi:MAG TPA: hypothetical protein IAA29_00900, partial [Candidatus Paenibacillus intestinavium]|nr:hypothetical protein [Candidatus Paenibacillus intestinavium]
MRKAEAQVYVVGTREPYFPSSFHIRRRLCYVSITIVITSRQFELPFSIKVKLFTCQHQEDGTLLEKSGSASVRSWY